MSGSDLLPSSAVELPPMVCLKYKPVVDRWIHRTRMVISPAYWLSVENENRKSESPFNLCFEEFTTTRLRNTSSQVNSGVTPGYHVVWRANKEPADKEVLCLFLKLPFVTLVINAINRNLKLVIRDALATSSLYSYGRPSHNNEKKKWIRYDEWQQRTTMTLCVMLKKYENKISFFSSLVSAGGKKS